MNRTVTAIAMLRPALLAAALSALAGCSAFNVLGGADASAPAAPAPQAPLVAAPDFGALFDGPLGAKIPVGSRPAAYAALGGALDSGLRKPWRGEAGLFGYFEPGGDPGACRGFKAVVYLSGRPQPLDGRACKSAAGDWRAP